MQSSTEQKAIDEISEWDVDRCRVICIMTQCLPVETSKWLGIHADDIQPEGVVHQSMRYYLIEHFKKLEEENGKDVS